MAGCPLRNRSIVHLPSLIHTIRKSQRGGLYLYGRSAQKKSQWSGISIDNDIRNIGAWHRHSPKSQSPTWTSSNGSSSITGSCRIPTGSATVGNCSCAAWSQRLNRTSRGTSVLRTNAKESEKRSSISVCCPDRRSSMFDSLADRIRRDERERLSTRERRVDR